MEPEVGHRLYLLMADIEQRARASKEQHPTERPLPSYHPDPPFNFNSALDRAIAAVPPDEDPSQV